MCLPYSKIMVSILFQHISINIKVSTMVQQFVICLIPTCIFTKKVSALLLQCVHLIPRIYVHLITTQCPPYYNIVSTLFQHVSKAKIVSSLFQHSGVRFIPAVVCLIPTVFNTRNCVHHNTPKSKKVSTLFCKCTPYSRLLRFRLNTVHLSTVSPPSLSIVLRSDVVKDYGRNYLRNF